MLRLFTLVFGLLPWIPVVLCEIKTEDEFSILEGRQLIVPCHYEPQYASYVKYWCTGWTREFCTILARTDDTRSVNPSEDKVSVSDDQAHQVFTVTMNGLKEGDSGWYSCGVEKSGLLQRDVLTFTKIKVVHGMDVVNSHVSGEEGGSVTVECLYSERFRSSEKKWCRSGDWSSCVSCSERSCEDASVAINDDRTGTFTVTLKTLQMRDMGWYSCRAGHEAKSVHVLVTQRPLTTAESVTSPPVTIGQVEHLPPSRPITKATWSGHRYMMEPFMVCFCLLAVFVTVILVRKFTLRRQDAAQRNIEDVEENKYSRDVGDLPDTAFVILKRDRHVY